MTEVGTAYIALTEVGSSTLAEKRTLSKMNRIFVPKRRVVQEAMCAFIIKTDYVLRNIIHVQVRYDVGG